jgi:hypothetical protein
MVVSVDRIGIGTTSPANTLNVIGISSFRGDVRVGVGTTQGLILTAPNGSLYRLTVSNTGVVSAISTSVLS